jgi:hypothetical protein
MKPAALLLALLTLEAVSYAQTTSPPFNNNITNTTAGQATGSILNTSQQINNFPALQYEYGPGYRCQGATLSITPYLVGANNPFGDVYTGNSIGYGGMLSATVPLDSRGINECIKFARIRASKEQFDLDIVRALRCLDFIKAGGVLTTAVTQQLCDGVGYNKLSDTSKGALIPINSNKPTEIVVTK